MTVAEFIDLTMFLYGVFVAVWFSNDLRQDIASATLQVADGTRISKLEHERQYWRNIYLQAFLIFWGVAWAILGVLEYFWSN